MNGNVCVCVCALMCVCLCVSIPLLDSLDKAFGRLFPANIMNDLFSAENLRETGRERKWRSTRYYKGKLKNISVRK